MRLQVQNHYNIDELVPVSTSPDICKTGTDVSPYATKMKTNWVQNPNTSIDYSKNIA